MADYDLSRFSPGNRYHFQPGLTSEFIFEVTGLVGVFQRSAGIRHCLIPFPRTVTHDRDKNSDSANYKIDCGGGNFDAIGVDYELATNIHEVLIPRAK